MNPNDETKRADAISFGHIDARAEGDAVDDKDASGESDRDADRQGISNRPGDVDPDEGIDPEPGNNA